MEKENTEQQFQLSLDMMINNIKTQIISIINQSNLGLSVNSLILGDLKSEIDKKITEKLTLENIQYQQYLENQKLKNQDNK